MDVQFIWPEIKSLLSDVVEESGPMVTFGRQHQRSYRGSWAIYYQELLSLRMSQLWKAFKFNLLSVSQFCNLGYAMTFNKKKCQLIHKRDRLPALSRVRIWGFCRAVLNCGSPNLVQPEFVVGDNFLIDVNHDDSDGNNIYIGDTTNITDESSSQPGNNSGGVKEGSTSQTHHPNAVQSEL